MKLVDLRTLPADLAARITDAKEGLVDALLNLTWQRCSGDGLEGELVFGQNPLYGLYRDFCYPALRKRGRKTKRLIFISVRTGSIVSSSPTPAAPSFSTRHFQSTFARCPHGRTSPRLKWIFFPIRRYVAISNRSFATR